MPGSACRRWGGRAAENERIEGFGDGLRVENLHFCMIFEYFQCLGARPEGLDHILSPRLGFFRFLRFDRREKVLPFWPKNDQKSFKKNDPKLNKFFDHFFDRFWNPLGAPIWSDFGIQNGAKIGSESVPRAIMKQMQIYSKSLPGVMFLRIRGAWNRSRIALKTMLS